MNTAELKKMTDDQVKQLATDLGVKYKQNNNKKAIIAKIEAAMNGKEEATDEVVETEGEASDELDTSFLDEAVGAASEDESAHLSMTSRQRKENESFERNHPALAASVAQQQATPATQNYKPHASVSKEMATPETAMKALETFFKRGLVVVEMTPTYWHLRAGRKEAAGNMSMPLSTLFQEVSLLFTATKVASDTGAAVK